MSVDRLSITLDPGLGAAARKAAKRAKVSLSTWIADANAARGAPGATTTSHATPLSW